MDDDLYFFVAFSLGAGVIDGALKAGVIDGALRVSKFQNFAVVAVVVKKKE